MKLMWLLRGTAFRDTVCGSG